MPETETDARPRPTNLDESMAMARPRPNVSYFIFVAVLFFFMTSRGPEDDYSDETSIEVFKKNLLLRERRRDGLAEWIGANTTYTSAETSLAANSTPVPYNLGNYSNPVLHDTMDRILHTNQEAHFGSGIYGYAQNLTGFVRGEWALSQNWTYEALHLPEVYKTLRKRAAQAPDAVQDPSDAQNSAAAQSADATLIAASPGNATASNATAAATNSTPAVNITASSYNRTAARGSFDWSHGDIVFNLREERALTAGPIQLPIPDDDGELLQLRPGPKKPWEEEGLTAYLSGEVTFTLPSTSTDITYDLEGVHFLTQGTFYGFVSPPYESSYLFRIPMLPGYRGGSTAIQHAAGYAVLNELDRRIEKGLGQLADASVPSSGTPVNASTPGPVDDDRGMDAEIPPCIFVVYGALSPLPRTLGSAYAEYYASLFHPTGASLPRLAPSRVHYLLYSENCGLVLEGAGDALPTVLMWERGTQFAVLMVLVQLVLAVCLARQMEWGSTPSGYSKVSAAAVGIPAAMDAYLFVVAFTIGTVSSTRASYPLLAVAFFALVASMLFGMRYASHIRSAHVSAREEPAEEPDTRLRRIRSALKWGTLGAAVVASIVLLAVAGWLCWIAIALFSYWIPQIAHNTKRGSARLSLRREYVIGTSAARLVMPLYFWAYADNVLSIKPSKWVYYLTAYSVIQAAVVLAQDSRWGARFFVPRALYPYLNLDTSSQWNYHPPGYLSDIESSGAVTCPICLERINLQVDPAADEKSETPHTREQLIYSFMVPPCHHIAHTPCLENWMAIKSVCPVCRTHLP